MGKLDLGDFMNLEKLYFLREERDLTQEDMSKIFNVSREAISKWENTKEPMSLIRLNMYANYFDVSIDYLVGLSSVKNYKVINTEIDKKLAGERLKEFRVKNELTQEALAKFLNTSHSTISAYENGKTLILTDFAYHICSKYNISMDWLCGRV